MTSNRLTVLAAGIKDADGRFRRSAQEAAAAAIDAGHRLIEAKALIPHGQWLPWLTEHCDMSSRTARRYMQLARSGFNIGHVADLGIRAAGEATARQRYLMPEGRTSALFTTDKMWCWLFATHSPDFVRFSVFNLETNELSWIKKGVRYDDLRTALQHLAWSFDIDIAHRTLLTGAEWQRDGSKLELMQGPLAPWDPKVFAPDG
jgi:hypothetical protein